MLAGLVCGSSCQEPAATGAGYKDPKLPSGSWNIIGIGGGGAMFNHTVSPHDPNVALVSCDMGGSYITYNGGLSWRMFNLRGGTGFFVFDPVDTNTIYTHSIGLFRSSDKGKTWSLIYPGVSDVVRIVARGDHGAEQLILRDSSHRKVAALAVDPSDSRKLYAAISVNDSMAFYTSDDRGEHWSIDRRIPGGVTEIFVDPSSAPDDRTLYFAGASGILTRRAGSWTMHRNPDGVSRLTKYSAGYSATDRRFIIYAISGASYFNPGGDESGIFYTDNGGAGWQNRQEGILKLTRHGSEFPEWRTIATSASHPGTVYLSYNALVYGRDSMCFGVAVSNDYGITWRLAWKDMLTPRGVVASSNVSGGWLDERFGPDWGENPFSIGVSPSDAAICFAGDFGRTMKTSDAGESWEQVYCSQTGERSWISRGLDVTNSYSIVFDPFDSNHVFIPTTDIGLIESRDGGRGWSSATSSNGVPAQWANTTYWMVFDPAVKGRAWAAMSGTHDLPRPKMFRKNDPSGFHGGIVITHDGGKSWRPVSADIGEAAVTHILLDEHSAPDKRVLYACAFGRGVFKSEDGGLTWKAASKGIEGNQPFAWQITRRQHDDALFLVVSRRSEDGSIGDRNDGAVYISTNAAESWIKVDLPEGVNGPTTIAFSKLIPDRIILSAWGRKMPGTLSSDSGGGIFVSDDGGKHWKQVLGTDQHIGAVSASPGGRRLYACGFNGSSYYSDDGGNKWERISGYNFKWGQRVEADPRDNGRVYISTFGGGVWHGPVGDDESVVEDIDNLPPGAYPVFDK